jgi:phosphoribosyl 1,2-cyclic phosphodiesterase
MIVRYWGVRGSIPVPGEGTVRYGGNTSCVSVEREDGILVLDAGTGIRELGRALSGTETDIYILLTHLHGDHIQGFPMFQPLYEPGRRVHALEYRHGGRVWSLIDLLDGIHWPVRPGELPSVCDCVRGEPLEFLRDQGFVVSRVEANHPGGAYGYRIEDEGKFFVHITDNEIDPPGDAVTSFEELLDFCRGAHVLSHDAQFLTSEMDHTRGWGHTDIGRACDLAVEAEVGHLVLFHHDPDRTDSQLDAIHAMARGSLEAHGIECTVAFEGLKLEL